MNRLHEEDKSLESQLSALIVDCLNSGKNLPTEKQMMEMFNVSRFILREALQVYEATGVVVSQQGSGRHVQRPCIGNLLTSSWTLLIDANPAQFLELLEVRFMLELGAVPKIINSIGLNELKSLHNIAEQMKLCTDSDSEFSKQDRLFHSVLYSCVGNEFYVQLTDIYWNLREKYDFSTFKHNTESLAKQHEEIVLAIISKDVDRVIALLQEQHEDAQYQVIMSLVSRK